MDLELHDKVVLVTKAGAGSGRAIGVAFAQKGARVALHYRSSAAGAEAGAAEARALGVKAMAVGADLRADGAVADAGRVERELGPIDVLVNNVAAATQRKPFLESTPGDWAPQSDVTVTGTPPRVRPRCPRLSQWRIAVHRPRPPGGARRALPPRIGAGLRQLRSGPALARAQRGHRVTLPGGPGGRYACRGR